MTSTNVHVDDEEHQLVPPNHPLHGLVWVDPGRMSGTPCFDQTRVPVAHLWDYLVRRSVVRRIHGGLRGGRSREGPRGPPARVKLLLGTLPKP